MPSRPARLLCVGDGVDHLQIRCAVLARIGYDAKSASVPEALTLLRTEAFDLIIFSAWLNDEGKSGVLSAAGKTPILVLTELTLPNDLLAKVGRLLVSAAQAVDRVSVKGERRFA